MTSFLGDGNRGLPIPDRQSMTDPGRDTTKVLLSEPMGLLGLFIRVWARVYLQNQNVSNTAVSLKPTPSLITTHKSWNPAALTERLANTSVGGKMSFTGSSGRSDPSLRSLSVSVSFRQLAWMVQKYLLAVLTNY